MKDWMKKGLAASVGLAVISKERMEKILRDMVNRGEMTPSASKELLEKLIARGEQEQEQLDQYLRGRMTKLLNEMNISTHEDIQRLEEQIHLQEERLSHLEANKQTPVQEESGPES
ncbi:polyhydroxyalkanoate synthesis regulator phasin [Kroppenstedtia sanguinis]|uniref:Phasin family protein n=1 Tax=Kroppenstedtia sanguinis TaxID=1380684 RepID=A0ABW4CBS9_9BACL